MVKKKIMEKEKDTFLDDFNRPLDKIRRGWIRRPSLIIMTPMLILIGAGYGIGKILYEMYKDCWNYKK